MILEETIHQSVLMYIWQETAPLVEYYKEKGLVYDIDANGDIQTKVDAISAIIERVK